MGKWSPYSEEWENAHLQKVSLDLFTTVEKQRRAYAQKTPIQRLLIKLRQRLRFTASQARFNLHLLLHPEIKAALDRRKSAGNVIAVIITRDDNGNPVATVLPSEEETT